MAQDTQTSVNVIRLTEYVGLFALIFGLSFSTGKEVFRVFGGPSPSPRPTSALPRIRPRRP